MPRNITITFEDGSQHVYAGTPDDVTPDAVQARAQQEFGKTVTALDGGKAAGDQMPLWQRALQLSSPAALVSSLANPQGRQDATTATVGTARGLKDVVDTGAELLAKGYDKITGQGEGARVQAMNDAGKQDFQQQYGDSPLATASRVGGNVAGTYFVGPVLGAGAKAAGLTRLGTALTTGGATTGAEIAPALVGKAAVLAKAADMGIRMAGGAATGGVSAGLIDPQSTPSGIATGALLPPVMAAAGKAGDVAASLVRPFFNAGQDRIVSDTLRQFATNPGDAAANLRRASEVVPGSAPTAVQAAGDEGLSGLSRTLQSADPRYAAELSTRASAQNAARTAALEGVAGNTGKLALAQEARDAATGSMREAVLDAAGALPASPVLDSIDRLIAKPDNAGKIAQTALNEVRNRIAQFAPDGQIDARALYAIRKDINDTLAGKLQGESGNQRLASGQLIDVKGIIDNAIDLASRRVQPTGTALMPFGANIERAGAAPLPPSGPRPTWQGYLQKYSQMSEPIDQMNKLDEVLKSVSTGSVDKFGNAILSGPKLNNLLRNHAQDLQKTLSPEQLDLLRRLSGDLNAAQLASNSGRAVGSNTVQNIAGVNMLQQVLGGKLGGSAPAQSIVGRALQLPYGIANKMIQNKLGQALLDPQESARLLQTPEGNALMRALTGDAAQIGYRAAPALAVQR